MTVHQFTGKQVSTALLVKRRIKGESQNNLIMFSMESAEPSSVWADDQAAHLRWGQKGSPEVQPGRL